MADVAVQLGAKRQVDEDRWTPASTRLVAHGVYASKVAMAGGAQYCEEKEEEDAPDEMVEAPVSLLIALVEHAAAHFHAQSEQDAERR